MKITIGLLLLVLAVLIALFLTPMYIRELKTSQQGTGRGSVYQPTQLLFKKQTFGPEPVGHPRITNVQIVSLDLGEPPGVLVCDAGRNAVLFYQKTDDHSGEWQERTLVTDVLAPAHATVVDIDNDMDLDVIVAILGNIEPDDAVIGRLLLLERDGVTYRESIILDDVRRVADVQPGDFDDDGDVDLAVAVFGYNRGQVLWLENHGDNKFRDHELLSAPGIIHVPVGDFDGDGDLDIAAGVTQDEEELWGFENQGGGVFGARKLWFTHNFDLGSAGLVSVDLDQDGDLDLILPAGDNLEDTDPYPQPYHGCYWFENKGHWEFEMKRISDLGGTYAAAAGDIDGDGDPDIALVSMANVWDEPDRASLVWLENDGHCNFTTWQIDSEPTHLVTVAIGDLDNDGRNDIIAGGLHIRGPYNRLGRVTGWLNQGGHHP